MLDNDKHDARVEENCAIGVDEVIGFIDRERHNYRRLGESCGDNRTDYCLTV